MLTAWIYCLTAAAAANFLTNHQLIRTFELVVDMMLRLMPIYMNIGIRMYISGERMELSRLAGWMPYWMACAEKGYGSAGTGSTGNGIDHLPRKSSELLTTLVW